MQYKLAEKTGVSKKHISYIVCLRTPATGLEFEYLQVSRATRLELEYLIFKLRSYYLKLWG